LHFKYDSNQFLIVALLFNCTFFFLAISNCQTVANNSNPQPVKWTVSFNVKEAKVGDVIELVLKGKVPERQHMYANDYVCKSVAYELKLIQESFFQIVGKPKSVGDRKYMDDIWM